VLTLACAFVLLGGCAVSRKKVTVPAAIQPAQTATKADLIALYNREASAVETLNVSVRLSPTVGSALSGVIEQYHEVNGYILAARPASIRVIGQAPVVAKDIFDMASDGQTFRIYVPSKNKFIVGPTNLRRAASKPIENLRPQHLVEALIWPSIPQSENVLLEEAETLPFRYYVLTVATSGQQGWELDRKIWFDRATLQMARIQIYGPGGELVSDIRTSDWQPVGGVNYPKDILLARPADEYQLDIHITQIALNQPIAGDKFQLAQPSGTELVQLGEEKQP
jgi:outer membrane lipoprotein-sorting protein